MADRKSVHIPARLGFVLVLSIILGGSSRASAPTTTSPCARQVEAFLTLPTKSTLDKLIESDQTTCWALFESSDASLDKLKHHVEHGNRWAAEYLSEHLKQLDGGNLEDALVALGQFSNHDMERFLWFAKTGLLSRWQFCQALTMLPLSLSDHPKAQLASLKRRRTNLARVTLPELSRQKTEGLSAIDSFEAEIKSHTQ